MIPQGVRQAVMGERGVRGGDLPRRWALADGVSLQCISEDYRNFDLGFRVVREKRLDPLGHRSDGLSPSWISFGCGCCFGATCPRGRGRGATQTGSYLVSGIETSIPQVDGSRG